MRGVSWQPGNNEATSLGCRDQVLSLVLIAQNQISKSKDSMLTAFIDFRKAYDTVVREKLGCLEVLGMRGRCLGFVKAMYKDNSSQVRTGESLGEHFEVSQGLRQGCVLLPILFSVYINGLILELKRSGYGVEAGGCLVPGPHVRR